MTHDFTGKSIKCETWEQMLHLAKLAEEQGYMELLFSENRYKKGYKYFEVNCLNQYVNLSEPEEDTVINYAMFMIVPLPTEVVEVTGCGDCPFSTTLPLDTDWCSHPNHENKGYLLFETCPLKKASITIKLKQDDTQTKEA
jgi:hypothetical protein